MYVYTCRWHLNTIKHNQNNSVLSKSEWSEQSEWSKWLEYSKQSEHSVGALWTAPTEQSQNAKLKTLRRSAIGALHRSGMKQVPNQNNSCQNGKVYLISEKFKIWTYKLHRSTTMALKIFNLSLELRQKCLFSRNNSWGRITLFSPVIRHESCLKPNSILDRNHRTKCKIYADTILFHLENGNSAFSMKCNIK